MMKRIAFIGTGIMGLPMALNLQKAGYQIVLSSQYRDPPDELRYAGAEISNTPADATRHADAIVLMLPDTPQVESVLFGENGVFEAIRSGQYVIDMSSISPSATKLFAKRIREQGAEYLDAPVSGGEAGAHAASLSVMVGGTEAAFSRCRPLFEAIGKNITHVGEVGAGQTAKVANQIIVAMNIQAVAEALMFATRNDVDPGRVRDALMGGFASSRVLEVHGERMIKGNFEPGFRMRLHSKDLKLALQGAQDLSISLPGTSLAHQLMGACLDMGGSEWDHSALIKVLGSRNS